MQRRVFLKNLLVASTGPALSAAYVCAPYRVITTNATITSGSASGNGVTYPLEKPLTEWRILLPADVYAVLFEARTERPFSSLLIGERRPGTFICAACAQPLFSSKTRYNSGTGWPSFYDALPNALGTQTDIVMLTLRTEYHCSRCGGHQGHVFNDGPAPTGKRYCNNGLALRFVIAGQQLPPLQQ